MSGDEKKTTSNSTQTQTSSIDPKYQQLQLDNYSRAQGQADNLSTPYTGQLTAGFGNYLDAPQAGYTALSNYQAPQLANTNLSPYMNPYTKGVVDTTSADLAHQYGIDQTAANGQATQAGAFGGSRSGVLAGQVYDNYNRNLNSTVAGLNQANFSNAQQAAQSDINTGLQSAGIRGSALAGLTGLGQMRQANDQDALTAAYNEFQRQQQGTLAGQQLLNSTLGTLQAPTTSTGTGNQEQVQTTTPGLGSMIGTGLQLASLAAAPFTGGASLAGGMGGLGSLFGGGGASAAGGVASSFASPLSLGTSGYSGFGGYGIQPGNYGARLSGF